MKISVIFWLNCYEISVGLNRLWNDFDSVYVVIRNWMIFVVVVMINWMIML